MTAIRVNLGVSLAYNVVGVALAATGHMSPLVAAILMPVSSLTVLSLALLLLSRGFGASAAAHPTPPPNAAPDSSERVALTPCP